MSNKKKKPAAGKSVAGKTNSGQNAPNKSKKQIEKQKAEAQKQAQRVREEREKAERERAKKSEEIQKRREKQRAKDEKTEKKLEAKEKFTSGAKKAFSAIKKAWKAFCEKVKYYTSKEFLGSFRYSRIFLFIVLPLALIGVGIFMFTQTVLVNVPSEIRDFVFNGRLESSITAKPSTFNEQQQAMFIGSVNAHGSGNFEFYINTEIPVGDDGETDKLRFGNPQSNDCVLVATVYDSDGEVLYRSLGLESGTEINKAKFFRELEYGTHEVKVAVNAYDSETNEKIGTKYAKIKLAVGV